MPGYIPFRVVALKQRLPLFLEAPTAQSARGGFKSPCLAMCYVVPILVEPVVLLQLVTGFSRRNESPKITIRFPGSFHKFNSRVNISTIVYDPCVIWLFITKQYYHYQNYYNLAVRWSSICASMHFSLRLRGPLGPWVAAALPRCSPPWPLCGAPRRPGPRGGRPGRRWWRNAPGRGSLRIPVPWWCLSMVFIAQKWDLEWIYVN